MLGKFGTCPRVLWKRHPVIPYGVSSDLNVSRVKVYWPLWKDIYIPKKGQVEVDGASYGPGFPHAILLSYPELIISDKTEKFIPKLYGFKIFGHKGSKYQVKFDHDGKPTNDENNEKILTEKRTDFYDNISKVKHS